MGETDEIGHRAAVDRVSVHDLHATILHALGLEHKRLTYRHNGRDFRLTDVEGRVIREILVVTWINSHVHQRRMSKNATGEMGTGELFLLRKMVQHNAAGDGDIQRVDFGLNGNCYLSLTDAHRL